MDESRKKFLMQLGSGLLVAGLPGQGINAVAVSDQKDFDGQGAADDEKFWKRIAKKYYEVSDDYINLKNGYYGIQPKPVLNAFLNNVSIANSQAARFARKDFPGINAAARKELADFLGVSDEEIIFTRNATEALNIAIQGILLNREMKCC